MLAILTQYIIEVLLVGVIAFPLSYLFSGVVAGEVGNIFADTQNVVVTTAHFIPVILGGVRKQYHSLKGRAKEQFYSKHSKDLERAETLHQKWSDFVDSGKNQCEELES